MAEVNKTNLRLITRLIESGITSEKQIMALKLKDILSIPNLTKPELAALCELQEAWKIPVLTTGSTPFFWCLKRVRRSMISPPIPIKMCI